MQDEPEHQNRVERINVLKIQSVLPSDNVVLYGFPGNYKPVGNFTIRDRLTFLKYNLEEGCKAKRQFQAHIPFGLIHIHTSDVTADAGIFDHQELLSNPTGNFHNSPPYPYASIETCDFIILLFTLYGNAVTTHSFPDHIISS